MNNFTITIAGPSGSWLTVMQQWLLEHLETKLKTVDVIWEIDGEPLHQLNDIDQAIDEVSKNANITLMAKQTKRGL